MPRAVQIFDDEPQFGKPETREQAPPGLELLYQAIGIKQLGVMPFDIDGREAGVIVYS